MFGAQEQKFIQEILSDPKAEGPRAVFADWLEERGDPRSSAVRFGIKRIALERELFTDFERFEILKKQQRNINIDYSAQFRAALPQFDGVQWRAFEGGVIEQVKIDDPEAFRRHTADILDLQPIFKLECPAKDEASLLCMLANPELGRLGGLTLGGNRNGPALTRALKASLHLANLRFFTATGSELGIEGMQSLADADHLEGLFELDLTKNELNDQAMQVLCRAEQLQSLQCLGLGWNELGPASITALLNSGWNNLRYLDLYDNTDLTEESVAQLFAGNQMQNLRWLNLESCKLGPRAGQAIFSGNAPNLARVNLIGNTTNQDVLQALAAGEFTNLCELHLEIHEWVNGLLATALAEASWLPQLTRLVLREHNALNRSALPLLDGRFDALTELSWQSVGNLRLNVKDEAVSLLAANQSLQNLNTLHLGVPLSDAAVDALCHLDQLKLLRLPASLIEHESRLTTALPNCKIAFSRPMP